MPEETRVPSPEAARRESSAESPSPETKSEAAIFESRPETLPERVGEKYQNILSKVKSTVPPPSADIVLRDVGEVGSVADTASTVAKLVALAETKGVPHAVAVAQRMHDYYLLDRMHDELADTFYEALKAKGLVD